MPPADVVTPQLLRSWALPEVDDGGDKHARGTVLAVDVGSLVGRFVKSSPVLETSLSS